MNWRAVWAIALKDIFDAVRNRYLLFALILPVGMSLLFGLLFAEPEIADPPTLAVYAPDNTEFVTGFAGIEGLEVVQVSSEAELRETVGAQVEVGVVVPAGFEGALRAGEHPVLQVYDSGGISGGVTSFLHQLIQDQVWQLADMQFPAEIRYEALAASEGAGDAEFARENFSLQGYLLGLLLVMALSMTGGFVVPYLLVEEKEKRTLSALLLSPAGPAEVIAGKGLVGMFYSVVIAGLLIALNRGWQGDWPWTLAALALGSLFIVAVGLLIGSLAGSMHQVNTSTSIVMLGLMLPSWIGPLNLPEAVKLVVQLIPTYYMSAVLNLSLAGQAVPAVALRDLGILAVITVLAFAIVVWNMKRSQRA
jgi:ABC-2 type transport system permease protein